MQKKKKKKNAIGHLSAQFKIHLLKSGRYYTEIGFPAHVAHTKCNSPAVPLVLSLRGLHVGYR